MLGSNGIFFAGDVCVLFGIAPKLVLKCGSGERFPRSAPKMMASVSQLVSQGDEFRIKQCPARRIARVASKRSWWSPLRNLHIGSCANIGTAGRQAFVMLLIVTNVADGRGPRSRICHFA